MRKFTLEEMEDLDGGHASDCAVSIGLSAAIGGFFGGVGSLVGAAVAATGPSCAGLWG